jgi:hypothetical protein
LTAIAASPRSQSATWYNPRNFFKAGSALNALNEAGYSRRESHGKSRQDYLYEDR